MTKQRATLFSVLFATLLSFTYMAKAQTIVKVARWQPHDFEFKSTSEPTNPFAVNFAADITGPDGIKLTLPGFFEGNHIWKIRFSPTKVGKWLIKTRSDIISLNNRQAIVTCTKNKNTQVHGGLMVDKSKRHFVYEDGSQTGQRPIKSLYQQPVTDHLYRPIKNIVSPLDTSIRKWGDWQAWGDQGNGTYINPVLPGDYSDIDCIRVGSDYYAVSSTFQYSPGFVILHSKDLVNWKILSHAVNDITQISPEMNWDRMNRYGRGIWAGAIRYHNKKFWIYFGTPDEGYFMSTAKKAEGPWAPLHKVWGEKGWDDCCPFWDDDGQGYLIGTHFSDGYKIHLFKMTPDGKTLIRESDQVIHQSKGSEANKLYKIKDTYYHFFSEVRAGGRAIMMERSKNIYGPYTEVKQLSHPQKQLNEPNQGGIVQTQKGDWYFLNHHGTGDWSGRVMSLLPVHWVNGWPIIGEVGKDTIGRMVWGGRMPLKAKKIVTPQTSDEFNKKTLPPQWEWNYQPRAGKWSLTERKGWLRLHAFKPIEPDNLLKAGNTLTQRTMRTKTNEVIVRLDISEMKDGQKAGLSHFGVPNYSTIGVSCYGTTKVLAYNIKRKITNGPILTSNNLWLKSTWGLDGKSLYYYSTDGENYTPFGDVYQMSWGSYRGDRIAIYNYNNKADDGYIDVDFFHYSYSR